MSQDAHHEHDGGHELEAINVWSLFKLIGASIVIVSASEDGDGPLYVMELGVELPEHALNQPCG